MNSPASDSQGPVDVIVACRDNDARAIVGEVLRHAGWRVHVESHPAAVLAAATAWHPLLVITSYPTVTSDHCSVAETLRAHPRTTTIPILNITGHAFPSELAQADAAGVTASLVMPVSPVDVVREVERLIGPPNGARPSGSDPDPGAGRGFESGRPLREK